LTCEGDGIRSEATHGEEFLYDAHILIEEERHRDAQLQHGISFRPQTEGQDLVRVRQGKTGESDVVGTKVQEEESNGGVSGSFSLVLRIDSGTGGNGDVTDQHADCRSEPEETTTQTFAQKRSSDSEQPVPEHRILTCQPQTFSMGITDDCGLTRSATLH